MLRDIFQSVRGVDHYGLISTFIFIVFFGLVVFYTFSLKKKDVEECRQMPLEDSGKGTDEV